MCFIVTIVKGMGNANSKFVVLGSNTVSVTFNKSEINVCFYCRPLLLFLFGQKLFV